MHRYYFNNSKNYIESFYRLSKKQLAQLTEIMSFFPYNNKHQWPETFKSFQPEKYPSKLVYMAANAFDHKGYTMLGLACEYGKEVNLVQTMIDMGAHLDKPDHNMRKLPLHRAINNQLSTYNRNSLQAVAVVECLLKNGANPYKTCFQNRTPLFFAQFHQFKAAANLIEKHNHVSRDYAQFKNSLLVGEVSSLKKMLESSSSLASLITTLKGWSPIFSAIHQSYAHRRTVNCLDLLKRYNVNFKSTFYIKTYSGIPVYCSVNPIAYLLLRGGDSRLIDALIKHGADPKHSSIAIVKKIIELHPNNKAFNYAVNNDNNPFDANSKKLLALFETKINQHHQEISNTNNNRFTFNSKRTPRLFQPKINKPNPEMSISNEDMVTSNFGKGSFTAKGGY